MGANNRRAREFDIDEKGLIVEVKRPVRGYLLNDSVDLEKFSKVRIEWGVIEYPAGASYERNVNNEPAMLIVFFGYDKISSGHFAIPSAPYFIGFCLGKAAVDTQPTPLSRRVVGEYDDHFAILLDVGLVWDFIKD